MKNISVLNTSLPAGTYQIMSNISYLGKSFLEDLGKLNNEYKTEDKDQN